MHAAGDEDREVIDPDEDELALVEVDDDELDEDDEVEEDGEDDDGLESEDSI